MSPSESPLFNPELADFFNLCFETVQSANGEHLTKVLTPEEFWSLGYLQESNRRFFHPLGLALTVQIDADSGAVKLGQILNGREHPTGICFTKGMLNAARIENIDREWTVRSEIRKKELGYVVQHLV